LFCVRPIEEKDKQDRIAPKGCYEGKMVQAFDHRASDILLADGNLFRTGQGRDLSLEEHKNPNRVPVPRYWIDAEKLDWAPSTNWCIAIKDNCGRCRARSCRGRSGCAHNSADQGDTSSIVAMCPSGNSEHCTDCQRLNPHRVLNVLFSKKCAMF
jgi:hypothetical protein